MSTTFAGNLIITSNWSYQHTDPMGNPKDEQNIKYQCKQDSLGVEHLITKIYRGERVVSSGTTTDDIDLYGGLTDVFGNTLNFATIREIIITNLSTVAGDDLLIGAAGANPWVAPSAGDGTAQAPCRASGSWVQSAPLDGLAVSNGASDILRVTYSGSSPSISYYLIVKGT